MTGRDEAERPAGYRRMSRERFIGRMMRDAEKRLSGEDTSSVSRAADSFPSRGSLDQKREQVRPRSTEDVVFQYIIDQNTKRLHDLSRQSRKFRNTGHK